jgi:hypothetical protein
MPHAHIARVVVQGHHEGQIVENVLHFGNDEVTPNWTQLALDVIDCLATTFIHVAASTWTLDRVIVTPIYPTLQDPIEVTPVSAVAGDAFRPGLPSFNAGLISIQTGGGGCSGKGRMFMPGIAQGDVAEGLFTDAGLAHLVAFAVCMAGKFIASGDPPVPPTNFIGVLSRKGITQATVAAHFRDATQLIARRIVARMGSRKIGRGV